MDHGWLSVLPPLIAIGLALVARQVVLALLLGVWVGAVIIHGDPLTAFLRLGDHYLVDALADRSHASIVLFSTILGGMCDRCFSAHINRKKSKCDYFFDRLLSKLEISQLQEKVNQEIEKDHRIVIEKLSKAKNYF